MLIIFSFSPPITENSSSCGQVPGLSEHWGYEPLCQTVKLAVFRREEHVMKFGDRMYSDLKGTLRFGKYIYRPMMTVKNSEVVFRDIAF